MKPSQIQQVAPIRVEPAWLANFVPIKTLTPDHLKELAEKSKLVPLPNGRHLFKQGDKLERISYLLKGTVMVILPDGSQRQVTARTQAACLPLEQGPVHTRSCVAKTDCLIVMVDPNLLDIMLTWTQSGGYEVQELDHDSDGEDWMSRLLQAKVFHRIPPANIQSIFMRMEAQPFKPGEHVIKQGEEGDKFYLVREGSCDVVRRTRKNPDGVHLATLRAGDNFGEEALISGGKRNASVVMKTPGVLMSLKKQDFLDLMNAPLLKDVDIQEAKKLMEDGAIWIDVRLPQEHQERSIPGSINIPLPILRTKLDRLDGKRTYIVYCDTGRRSSTATYLLTQNGFSAYILKGGLQNVPADDLAA